MAIVGKPDVSAELKVYIYIGIRIYIYIGIYHRISSELKAIIAYTYYATPPLLYLLCSTYWTY